MRFVKYLCLFLCAFSMMALAAENKMGIREVNRINFQTPIYIGATALPAGDYVVRHTMEGENHVMVFQIQNGSRQEFKVKCTLVPLEQKATQSQTIYEVKGSDRLLQELVFRGDMAKHVF
jgi:hypothetical protein